MQSHAITCNHMQSHAITCNHMQSPEHQRREGSAIKRHQGRSVETIQLEGVGYLSINEEKVRGLEITMGNGETMQMRQPARHLIQQRRRLVLGVAAG